MDLAESPKRDLFLLKELRDDTAEEIIKGIIEVNIFDEEQEQKVVGYKRPPIRLHICTPRRKFSASFCNM